MTCQGPVVSKALSSTYGEDFVKYDGETVEVADMEWAKIVMKCIVDKKIVHREESELRMLLLRRWRVEGAQVQPI